MLIAMLFATGHGAVPDAIREEALGLGAELIDAGATDPLRAANAVLARGRDERRDVVLLDVGAMPGAGALAELVAVSRLDPMIGFVHARVGDPNIAHRLPRVTYDVHARGGCLLVRHAMAIEFGLLDEGFATLAAATADLSLAANRCGYRAVAANRATVSSRAPEDAADMARLRERHPTLDRSLARHAAGTHARAETLAAGLATDTDGRLGLLFDCRMMHAYFSGTFEHARQLLRAFAARHGATYRCHVLISDDGWRFHRFAEIAGLVHVAPDATPPAPLAVAFRLAQPFDAHALASLAAMAPIAGFLMLDTIALDCQHLDEAGLERLWQAMADSVGVLGFNSQFSRDQFNRRFAVPADVAQRVSLCSTDVADYAVPAAGAGGGVLMVGNHYPHKALAATLDALCHHDAAGRTTVMGLELDGAAAGYHAGGLPQDLVDRLYDDTRVLLFPSHYEGFGLPVMNALARQKPVVARDMPCLREIALRTPFGRNIHLRADTAALAALAADPPEWDSEETAAGAHDWGAAADALADGFAEAIVRFDFGACRRRQGRIAAIADATSAGELSAAVDDARRAAAVAERGAALERLVGDDSALRHRAAEAGAFTAPRARYGWPLVAVPTVDVRRGAPSLAAIVAALLDRAARLVPGARLRLLAPPGLSAVDARAALIAAGYSADRIARRFGRVRIEATLVSRWTDLLPGPADDELFVEFCHRLVLRRPADEAALDRLAGADRRTVLRDLLASDERVTRIAAALTEPPR